MRAPALVRQDGWRSAQVPVDQRSGGPQTGLAGALLGRRLPVFALTAGAMVALVALAYLTAWWQLDVLRGVAIDDRQRLAAGLWDTSIDPVRASIATFRNLDRKPRLGGWTVGVE